MLPRCSECAAQHDPRPCARDGVACACCAAIYRDQAERGAACNAMDADQ